MDVRSRQSIVEHLQKEDVQERVIQSIHRGRDEATVTISRAAELFGITENKLRDWEEYGILNPLRPGGPKGRRLYTPTELDKLAIIRELISTGYTASDIPADLDQLWQRIRTNRETRSSTGDYCTPSPFFHDERSINQRINQVQANLFWRYFINHSLRMALRLICEEIPNTAAGLILPLSPMDTHRDVQHIEELAMLGESLVGWLSSNGSSQALLTTQPHFQYSSDFRIEHLQSVPRKQDTSATRTAHADDPTLIILQREAHALQLNSETTEVIQRLLQPLYQNVTQLHACMGYGARDIIDPATEINSTLNYEDTILNGLADSIVQLGGLTATGKPRWRLCWILLPHDTAQPLLTSDLTIKAQSHDPTMTTRLILSTFDKQSSHPYIKALQGRHVSYQPNIPPTESQEIFRNLEAPIRSDLALPITGENGAPLGVLYVASQFPYAFQPGDQRMLRLLNLMIEELLRTYYARQQTTRHLAEIMKNPLLIDPLFGNFLSANDFNSDVETLLTQLWENANDPLHSEQLSNQVVSFMAIDIDKHNSLISKYGERVARNLTREIGLRILEQLRTSFKEYPECQLYHIHADRFFVILRNTSLEQTREHAERLRMGTIGTYKLNALRVYPDQHSRPESMIELNNVTVRLGITSYDYFKLYEILRKHSPAFAVPEVRSIITSALEAALARGQVEGGNVVVSWDYELRNFLRWSPPKK